LVLWFFLPGRVARSTPPQTPNRSPRSSAAWLQSSSTGQPLHHLTAIARWAACSAVHSSRVMGSLQRGRSPAAARDRRARLSPSVAVMGWPARGVRRHGKSRGVNTFGRRIRFNFPAPKGERKTARAMFVDTICKWAIGFGSPAHGWCCRSSVVLSDASALDPEDSPRTTQRRPQPRHGRRVPRPSAAPDCGAAVTLLLSAGEQP
jgi:hypothetical protein